MRRGAAALILLSIAAAAPAQAREQEQGPYPWEQRAESAERFAKSREGRVDWAAVTPDGRVRGARIHVRHESASVVKAMLLVAYLNHDDVPGRDLTAREKRLLKPMITRSDNRAATRVRDTVGNAGLARLARRVGMKDFATAPSWGSTQISPYDQTRFFFRIDSWVPERHRGYARALLANVVESQRWGVPPVLPDGWRIYFKGGWVPPSLINQVALLERGDQHVALAVFTDGAPSFRYGQETIEGVARRLLLRLGEFAG
jgi:hypothetical protein